MRRRLRPQKLLPVAVGSTRLLGAPQASGHENSTGNEGIVRDERNQADVRLGRVYL